MSTIFVEYRPRLGAAHVYISISDQSSISTTRYSAIVAPNENAIIVADHCEDVREIYKFLWPENSGKILLTGPGKQRLILYYFLRLRTYLQMRPKV